MSEYDDDPELEQLRAENERLKAEVAAPRLSPDAAMVIANYPASAQMKREAEQYIAGREAQFRLQNKAVRVRAEMAPLLANALAQGQDLSDLQAEYERRMQS